MPLAISGPQPGAKRFLNYVVIIFVITAIAWFLNAMSGVEKQIEQIAVEKKINEMNASLTLTFYSYTTRGKLAELQRFHLGNPFIFLAINYQLPPDYHGVIQNENEINKSGWYYHLQRQEVIYEPVTDIGRHRFTLEFGYTDVNQSGVFELVMDEIKFFKLIQKRP